MKVIERAFVPLFLIITVSFGMALAWLLPFMFIAAVPIFALPLLAYGYFMSSDRIINWRQADDRSAESLTKQLALPIRILRTVAPVPVQAAVKRMSFGASAPCVLIVEDDLDLAIATESVFRQLGCETISCSGLDEVSQRQLSFSGVDLVVLDWCLGQNFSGEQLLRKAVLAIDALKAEQPQLSNQFAKKKITKIVTYSVLPRSEINVPNNVYFAHFDHWRKPIRYDELSKKASDLMTAIGY